jgi:hypothetical protein
MLSIVSCDYNAKMSCRYWGIFWIDGSTRDSIQRCWTQFALVLLVDKDIDSVKRVLANASRAWLLVFDNADDPNLPLAPYFPAGDRGDIIISTRNPECRQYSTVGSREIGRMSYEDSRALLFKTTYGDTALDGRFKRGPQSCGGSCSSRVSNRPGRRLCSRDIVPIGRVSRTLSTTSERGARVFSETQQHGVSLHSLHDMAGIIKYN